MFCTNFCCNLYVYIYKIDDICWIKNIGGYEIQYGWVHTDDKIRIEYVHGETV